MNREELAQQEIGHTEISRLSAWIVVVLFAATLLLVPGVQVAEWAISDRSAEASSQFPMLRSFSLPARAIRGAAAEDSVWARLMGGNRAMLREIASIEDSLDNVGVAGEAIRPVVQEALASLGWGTERVLLGNQGWLFFEPAVDYLTSDGFLDPEYQRKRITTAESWKSPPSPDPVKAILDFAEDLDQRGIELIVLPVPVKAGGVPERLTSRCREEGVLHNPSWPEFTSQLEANGLWVEGIDEILIASAPAFLKTDTHWSWASMDAVAQRLAEQLRTLDVNQACTFEESSTAVAHRGDLYQMLPLVSTSMYPEEAFEIRSVSISDCDQNPGRPPIVLLGDSFSNIYSDEGLGWGEDAGLSERLSWHLQTPVTSIVRNNDGAFATRNELARRLARDSNFLDGVRFVVWQFTERELSFGDWRLIDLGLEPTDNGGFVALVPGETRRVHGTIQAMGELPDPSEAEYPDYLLALHLTDVYSTDASQREEAVVFVWAMKDYELLPGAFLHPSESVTLEIQPWADVASTLDTITRGEIYTERLLQQNPCWAEMIKP